MIPSSFRFENFHRFRWVVYFAIWMTLLALCIIRAAFSVAVTGLNPQKPPNANDTCPNRATNKSEDVKTKSITYDWSGEQSEVAIFTFNLGYMLGHVPGAFATVKFGSHRTMTLVLCGCTALVFVSVISAPIYWLFVVVRVGIGFISGSMYQIVNQSVAAYAPGKERSVVLLFVHTANLLACAIIFPMGGLFIQYFIDGWKLVYLFSGFIGLFSMVLWAACAYSDPDENPLMSYQEQKYIRDGLYPKGKPPKKTLSNIPYRKIFTDKQLYIFFLVHYGKLQILYSTLLGVVKYFSRFFTLDPFKAGMYGVIPFVGESVLQICYTHISSCVFRDRVTVKTQRKINTLIGAVGCSLFLFMAFFVNCHQFAAGLFLQTASLMFLAPYQAGYFVGIVERYGPLCGFTYSFINVFGSFSGIVQRIMIIIIMKVVDQQYRLGMQYSFIFTSVLSLLFSIPYVLFGDSTPVEWARKAPQKPEKLIVKDDVQTKGDA